MITKKQKAEKACSISGLTCKGMCPILGQRHLNGRIILCSTKYVHPIKSRPVPADEFGYFPILRIAQVWKGPYNCFQESVRPRHKTSKESTAPTLQLPEERSHRAKKGTKTKIVFPFGLRRSSHPKSLSLQHVLCCCGILVGYVKIKLPRIKNRI